MNRTPAKNRVREIVPGAWAEFDSLVQHLLGPQVLGRPLGQEPAASLWEKGDAYHVELDVPGVPRDAIELTFEKGVLRVALERPAPAGDRQGGLDERRYGKAERAFKLPESVDVDSIAAELNHGVLHVVVKKRPESQPRRIEISAS